ncbi:MAG: AAA-like domain-containing protein [Actinomycetota bacterium]|nr:AAA-like domain-containing protein [Actinomycetota bacterium]
MASPFYYEDPVSPADLIDRGDALAALVDRMLALRNSRIEGPRRFGKTSLVQAALAQAEKQGSVAVYVNFLGVLTPADVAERIDRAYSRQLHGALKRWFDGVVRTWRPSVTAAPGGVGVTAQPHADHGGLLDRLALPARMAERHAKRCAVVFDEFQELVRIGPHVPGVFRSELEQQRDVAAYVFTGSHPGLMRDLFADRRHAFFAQAAPIPIGPLPPDALADAITERFAVHAGRDPGDALGPLLDLARGHPQRAMLLAHHLFESTAPRTAADEGTWQRACTRTFAELTGEVTAAWASLSDLERRVLAAVADEGVTLYGAQARERYGLAKSASSGVAADRLWAAGHLLAAQTPTRWQVTDPLLRLWVANGRRWP